MEKAFFLVCLIPFVHSHSILFYNPIGTHSMRISQWPLVEALAERGHQVTFLSGHEVKADSSPNKSSKVDIYVPPKWGKKFGDWYDYDDVYETRRKSTAGIADYMGLFEFLEIGLVGCEALMTDPDFLNWARTHRFDLVIVEGLFDECGYALVHLWKAKMAQYSTCPVVPWMIDRYGIPDETSSIQDFSVPADIRYSPTASKEGLTFFQRIRTALAPLICTIWREHFFLPRMEKIIKEGLGEDGKDFPGLAQIEKNNSLVLVTSHISMDHSRSYPPHVIPIGGNVVAKKLKPLPKDLEAFIESGGASGFIYISFGTALDFTRFPEHVQREFVKALESFPEMKFVWKAHSKITAAKVPENVFETKWVPQQTLLSHPKLKAFVTHCGMGSVVESIHFGVPLILVPVGPEQDMNGGIISARGAGIKVEIVDLKRAELENAIREILHNDKYKKAMEKLSRISKDRPMPPVENGVWWIEYILRHDSDIHEFLVPPSVHQPWWVRRQIDVWVTLATVIATFLLLTLYIILRVLRKITSPFLGSRRVDKSNVKSKRN